VHFHRVAEIGSYSLMGPLNHEAPAASAGLSMRVRVTFQIRTRRSAEVLAGLL
jgi:hypothetical protein